MNLGLLFVVSVFKACAMVTAAPWAALRGFWVGLTRNEPTTKRPETCPKGQLRAEQFVWPVMWDLYPHGPGHRRGFRHACVFAVFHYRYYMRTFDDAVYLAVTTRQTLTQADCKHAWRTYILRVASGAEALDA